MRLTMRSRVVLPQPDDPSRTVVVPASIRAVKESTAGEPDPAPFPAGYDLVTASKVMVLLIAGAGCPLMALGGAARWRIATVPATICRSARWQPFPRRLVQD